MKKIYPSKPSVGIEEINMIQDVFESNWLGMGSSVNEFESEIEKYIGNGIVIAVNSGTSALHLALESLGIGRGDEVIVPSLTFCASVQVITALGATPVFCDVKSSDLCIDINDVKLKITSRTKVIVPVHYCGIVSDMDLLLEIKHKHGIRIIEDAAHAFGSSYKGKQVGSFGDICCFSFDPIKNITCGEGGAIIVHDENHANLIRKKRMLGIDKDGWLRHTTNTTQKDYDVVMQGYRYHMSDINAAIGIAQLAKIDSFRKKKSNLVQLYNMRLSKIKQITILEWNLPETFPFAYVIKVVTNYRNSLVKYLFDRNIQTGLNYIPNHLQSFFKTEIKLPATEKAFNEIITLPLYYDLSNDEVDYIINCIKDYFKEQETQNSYNFEK